jgi:hypothetical protein
VHEAFSIDRSPWGESMEAVAKGSEWLICTVDKLMNQTQY